MARVTFGSIWGHSGITLGSLVAYGGALKRYLNQIDVEKLEMASVMGICGSLVGPKSENVEKQCVFVCFFKAKNILGKSSNPPVRTVREGVGGG